MSTVPRFGVLNAPESWRTVDFISDLHLMPEEPATHAAWQRYMASTPADAVFILGDLFEAWIGDDAALPGSFEGDCAEVLRQAAARLPVYLMHGNRDFLVGEPFLGAHGVQFLADPTVLDWAGARYLLTHGDLLCTQDVAYQRFRQQVRSPDWQRAVLARPLSERQVMAQQMRAQSVAAGRWRGVCRHRRAAGARMADGGGCPHLDPRPHPPAGRPRPGPRRRRAALATGGFERLAHRRPGPPRAGAAPFGRPPT